MNAIEVKNLKFRYYKQDHDTINNISFVVEQGTIFGLLGPSGAGKSTTQKILTKLLPDYEGEVIFLGKNLKQYGKEFFENVGVGFELPVHFNKLTALENLNYFAALYQKKANFDQLLDQVGLKDAKNQEVGSFSKGMKVRLNFVRALINDPDVLFLDEPTNGLDPKNARIVKDIILGFKKAGKTVVITTHLMGDVEQLCDKVVFMTKGKLSEVSTPRDLKIRYGERTVTIDYDENGGLVKKIFPMEQLGDNPAFLDTIRNHHVETIHSGETTLEEIFIKVTGDVDHA